MDLKSSPHSPQANASPPAMLRLEASSPQAAAAWPLLDALSEQLGARFGSDGRASFTEWQAADPRYIFLLAWQAKEAVGCGAVRPLAPGIGEVKRMFARYARQGIGQAVLQQLEVAAQQAGYTELWLETRVANTEACHFYLGNGYQRRVNYGQYLGRENSACFGKQLQPNHMTASNLQQLVQDYVAAYNRFDVAGMLAPLHDDVVFRNISDGEVSLTTTGKESFRQQAEQATRYFSQRTQRITDWQISGRRVEVTIDYQAVAAIEFPNGLQPGDTLSLVGRSVFEFEDGKIISITDFS
jgi:ketosteroid isomerase-like protein/GNAT superfamily N-acetyltransferase